MSGQATVTVGANVWSVTVMTSAAELIAGLSGVSSIPPGTGMLFDLGGDSDYININMADMLFSLDIVFINSEQGVVGVLREVEPEDTVAFDAGAGYGARYFMEVNAEEAESVNVGDDVNIEGEDEGDEGDEGSVQPTFWAVLLAAIPALVMVMSAAGSVYKDIKETNKS